MYILVTYDVETSSPSGARRLRNVARLCQNYGQRVQNSVFECLVDESQYITLKAKLQELIDIEADSIRFFSLGNKWERKIDHIGRETSINLSGDLVV